MTTVNWIAPFPDLMEVTIWRGQGQIIYAHMVDQGCDGRNPGYGENQKRPLTHLRGFFEEEVSTLRPER